MNRISNDFKFIFLQALLTLFVFSTKDGWVTIMYDGLDSVGVDKQVLKKKLVKMVIKDKNYFSVSS